MILILSTSNNFNCKSKENICWSILILVFSPHTFHISFQLHLWASCHHGYGNVKIQNHIISKDIKVKLHHLILTGRAHWHYDIITWNTCAMSFFNCDVSFYMIKLVYTCRYVWQPIWNKQATTNNLKYFQESWNKGKGFWISENQQE